MLKRFYELYRTNESILITEADLNEAYEIVMRIQGLENPREVYRNIFAKFFGKEITIQEFIYVLLLSLSEIKYTLEHHYVLDTYNYFRIQSEILSIFKEFKLPKSSEEAKKVYYEIIDILLNERLEVKKTWSFMTEKE